MDALTLFGIALVIYGLLTLAIAVFKPRAIWQIGKIQGFVQLLSERGTVILFFIVAALTIGAGSYVLLVY